MQIRRLFHDAGPFDLEWQHQAYSSSRELQSRLQREDASGPTIRLQARQPPMRLTVDLVERTTHDESEPASQDR